MASLPVFDRTGKEVGTYEVEWTDIVPRINKQLLHDVVVMYHANRRQGSHKTKSRGEVAGNRQKMYRQKGTGRARAGARRAAQRRGGGHVKHKQPTDYSYRLPKKAVRVATRMAIASKLRSNQVKIIDGLSFDAPKTRDMAAILKALDLAGNSTLVAIESHNVNVYKSARNIDRVTVSPVEDLNALAVLTPRQMLVTRAALDAIKSGRALTKTNGEETTE
jgi:large subunit ribosomal protein L4